FFRFRKDIAQIAPQGVEAEFRRLHYDTANATHPASMAALLQVVPDPQVVFGSDYPYFPPAPQAQALEALGLSAAQVSAIESGNATRLIQRLAKSCPTVSSPTPPAKARAPASWSAIACTTSAPACWPCCRT